MAVDSPADIAILGAGPIGLEAALYARFLGYEVQIYEKGEACQNVLDWKHVKMFSPFSMNATPLGLAAITAQAEDYTPPEDDAILTGEEFYKRYLKPLADTDLIADNICSNTEVLAVGRQNFTKQDGLDSEAREISPFRILVRSKGAERIETSDIVIDTTGTYGNRKFFGECGIPAVGEINIAGIHDDIPDLLGIEKQDFVDRHTLVVGSGYSAATTIAGLSEIIEAHPNTRVTWIVRKHVGADGPINEVENDTLAVRKEISKTANKIAKSGHPNIRLIENSCITLVGQTGDSKYRIELNGDAGSEFIVDKIVSNVGYRPDNSIFSELQVHQCYVTEGPMKLAVALMGSPTVDCLDQESHGRETLRTSEPHFYVLGSKSYGRNPNFLLAIGHQQIRDLFSMIGDRSDLDLYKTIQPLSQ